MDKRWNAATIGASLALLWLPLFLGTAFLFRDLVPPQWIRYDQGELGASMLIVSMSHSSCVLALADPEKGLPSEAAVSGLPCQHSDPWRRRFRYERSPRDPHLGRIVSFASDGREGGEDHAEDFVYWIRSDGSLGWKTSRSRSDRPDGVDW